MYAIREANIDDRETIIRLLEQADLVTNDILVPDTRYWVAVDADEAIIGVIGVEYGEKVALLRSALVVPEYRGKGIGAALAQTLMEACRASGHRTIYCFSTDAGDYWLKTGFREVPVAEVTESLAHAPQVADFDRRGWLPTEVTYRLDI